MKKILLPILVSCSLMSARATVTVFDAILNGPSESPPVASSGVGFGLVTYDSTLNTLQVQVLFAGLTSGTTASHIHAPTTNALTGTAGVATTVPAFLGFPIGVTSGSYSNTLDLTLASSYNPAYITANGGTPATAQAALVAAMFADKSYLNIHTVNFPNGEIRGFLVPIPEPSAVALMGLGVAGIAVRAWNKKRKA